MKYNIDSSILSIDIRLGKSLENPRKQDEILQLSRVDRVHAVLFHSNSKETQEKLEYYQT